MAISDNLTKEVKPKKVFISEEFTDLYSAVWKDLYRYAFYYIGNVEDAEDILQETALNAYRGFHNLKNKAAFNGWIFKILVTCCKRKVGDIIDIRKYHIKEFQSDSSFYETISMLEGKSPDLDIALTLKDCVSKLKDEERQIVLLSIVAGYNSNEIAEIVGLRSGSVRSKLSRTLVKLKKQL